MTPETKQATRFPASRLAIMAGLVLAVVAVPLVAGFLLFWEGGGKDDPLITPDGKDDRQIYNPVDIDTYGFHSLEKMVSAFPGRAHVVLARAEGDPEVRITDSDLSEAPEHPSNSALTIENIIVDMTVLEYLVGEGPSDIRVEQTSAFIKRLGDGTDSRGTYEGYVELTEGKTYVLFLQRYEGHPLGDDMWSAIGIPAAFEVDGQDLVSTYPLHTPADFGWSTLADVRRDAEAVNASLADGQ